LKQVTVQNNVTQTYWILISF